MSAMEWLRQVSESISRSIRLNGRVGDLRPLHHMGEACFAQKGKRSSRLWTQRSREKGASLFL